MKWPPLFYYKISYPTAIFAKSEFSECSPPLKIGLSWVGGKNLIVLLDEKIITGEKIIPSGTQDDKGLENRKRDIKIKQ